MRFRLTANLSMGNKGDIWDVIKALEDNLNSPQIIHEQQTMTAFFRSRKWQIDLRETHWELVIPKQYVNQPWFTEFLLRWT